MIFREFYQIDNPERDRGRGLGMGLAIVQRICRLLGTRWICGPKLAGKCISCRPASRRRKRNRRDNPEGDTLSPRKPGAVTVLLIDDERASEKPRRSCCDRCTSM